MRVFDIINFNLSTLVESFPDVIEVLQLILIYLCEFHQCFFEFSYLYTIRILLSVFGLLLMSLLKIFLSFLLAIVSLMFDFLLFFMLLQLLSLLFQFLIQSLMLFSLSLFKRIILVLHLYNYSTLLIYFSIYAKYH
jgi:hypothetical protein